MQPSMRRPPAVGPRRTDSSSSKLCSGRPVDVGERLNRKPSPTRAAARASAPFRAQPKSRSRSPASASNHKHVHLPGALLPARCNSAAALSTPFAVRNHDGVGKWHESSVAIATPAQDSYSAAGSSYVRMTAGCATGAYHNRAGVLQLDGQSRRPVLPPTGHLVGTATGPQADPRCSEPPPGGPRCRRLVTIEVELDEVHDRR
jgi:hypothetical protein